jgi:phosphoribosylformimino-5-aminoimidazole carboxamide ribotide isomerase
MYIIPAVDVLDGKAVRLQKGERSQSHVYHEDPADAARRWADGGARLIHLVNLNGAFGEAVDLVSLCSRIARDIRIPFQVGGGSARRRRPSATWPPAHCVSWSGPPLCRRRTSLPNS